MNRPEGLKEEYGITRSISSSTIKVGVIFLRRKRPGFDPEWGKEIESAARDALAKMEFNVFISEKRVVDDASLRQALSECRQAEIDVLIALQPTMSDGRLAPVLAQLWEMPVVFWATPERKEGPIISACSLVGTHTFTAIFRQLNRPFEIVYGLPGTEEAKHS